MSEHLQSPALIHMNRVVVRRVDDDLDPAYKARRDATIVHDITSNEHRTECRKCRREWKVKVMSEGQRVRAYVIIPKGGIKVNGVKFPEGPREMSDAAWLGMVLSNGAKSVDEKTYLKLKEGPPPATASEPKKKPLTTADKRKAEQRSKRTTTPAPAHGDDWLKDSAAKPATKTKLKAGLVVVERKQEEAPRRRVPRR